MKMKYLKTYENHKAEHTNRLNDEIANQRASIEAKIKDIENSINHYCHSNLSDLETDKSEVIGDGTAEKVENGIVQKLKIQLESLKKSLIGLDQV
jgi:hypothetical protein